jgi:hypothetical protein
MRRLVSGSASTWRSQPRQPAAEDFTRPYQQPWRAAASPAARDSDMPQHTLSPAAVCLVAGDADDLAVDGRNRRRRAPQAQTLDQ